MYVNFSILMKKDFFKINFNDKGFFLLCNEAGKFKVAYCVKVKVSCVHFDCTSNAVSSFNHLSLKYFRRKGCFFFVTTAISILQTYKSKNKYKNKKSLVTILVNICNIVYCLMAHLMMSDKTIITLQERLKRCFTMI